MTMISLPVTVAWAETFDILAAEIPDTRRATIEGAAHQLTLDAPDVVLRAIAGADAQNVRDEIELHVERFGAHGDRRRRQASR